MGDLGDGHHKACVSRRGGNHPTGRNPASVLNIRVAHTGRPEGELSNSRAQVAGLAHRGGERDACRRPDLSDIGSIAPAEFSLGRFVAVAWWSVGWSILFATAAKVVMVARFYSVFAAHLDDCFEALGPLMPARSPVVVAMESVGQTMLLFWLGIALSIALALPFGIRDWPHQTWALYQLTAMKLDPSHNMFVLTEVFITSILSIGMGTVIFLRSESSIRRAIRKVTNAALIRIEVKVRELFVRLECLSADEMKRMLDLNALHTEVAKTNSYRSLILSGFSLLLPLVGPLAGLFTHK
jgi:hypothetical protein